MRKMAWTVVLCAAFAAACGSSEGGGTGGSGGKGTGGATTTTTSTMPATTINGCDPSAAEDHTSENPAMVMFGGSLGNKYSPACLKIKAGSGVMFMGSFATHPLAGGVDGQADATSPIKETMTGTEVTFDNLPAGSYGFFCEAHDALGMHGAIFAE